MRIVVIALAVVTAAIAHAATGQEKRLADPAPIPRPLLAALPELAALVPVLERHGTARLDSLPKIEKKFFGGYQCARNAAAEATWFDPAFGYAFIGEHADCVPRGVGRIRMPSGHEWIGGVGALQLGDRVIPLPNGLGELRATDGTRAFLKARVSPGNDGRGALWLETVAMAWPDGSFGWRLEPGQPYLVEFWQADRLERYVDFVIKELQQARRFEVRHPTGAIVVAEIYPLDGRYATSPVTLRIPELGVTIEGGASEYGPEQASEPAVWSRWIFVTLARPADGLPAGAYLYPVPKGLRVPMRDGLRFVSRALIPADARTLAASTLRPQGCPRVPAHELPPRWKFWACNETLAIYYAPDASWQLRLRFSPDGAVAQRELEQHYGMAGANRRQRVIAERFEWRAGGPQPLGKVRYQAEWQQYLPQRFGPAMPADAAGMRFAFYEGPMKGLVPHGVGQCLGPQGERGGKEPCEYRDGRRVDPAFQAHVATHQAKRAQELAQEQQRQAQAAARASDEEAKWEALRRESREKDRQREIEYAEIDAQNEANLRKGWDEYAEKMQADAARFREESAAYQKQYDDAVAAQRARQAKPAAAPPGTRDAARAADDEAELRRMIAARRPAPAESGASAQERSTADAPVAPRSTRAPVPSECLVERQRKSGTRCGNPRSLSVEIAYVCGGKADVRICLGTPEGEDCGNRTVSEGGSASYYVCESDGGVRASGTAVD